MKETRFDSGGARMLHGDGQPAAGSIPARPLLLDKGGSTWMQYQTSREWTSMMLKSS